MTVVPLNGYWVVRNAEGHTIAQGSRELCELVAAGKVGMISMQADLFEEWD